jgi:hypothetical protein
VNQHVSRAVQFAPVFALAMIAFGMFDPQGLRPISVLVQTVIATVLYVGFMALRDHKGWGKK